MSNDLPRILFFNINGSGLGHLSRRLAYARRMRGRARPIFFSLASAIEIIEDMGFEADYFVSEFWSRSHINAWNRELASDYRKRKLTCLAWRYRNATSLAVTIVLRRGLRKEDLLID